MSGSLFEPNRPEGSGDPSRDPSGAPGATGGETPVEPYRPSSYQSQYASGYPSREALAAHAAQSGHDPHDEDAAPLLGGPEPARRRGRTVALVGGLLGIVVLGSGGAFAYSALSGGGAQPESVLPSTAVAFAKVDLDPSAGQKIDAVRFLRTFPKVKGKVSEDADLRKVAFEALQKDGTLKGVDYAKDVEPWLGQRLGVALVPGASAKDEPTPVIALAVTDGDAARKSLPSLATGLGGACRVLEDYAVCTQGKDGAVLDGVVTATGKGTLADSADFRKDMADLGEDGVAAAWFDSEKAAPVMAMLGGAAGVLPSGAANPAGSGRTAVALRFDGPNLELAGHVNGAKTQFMGTQRVGAALSRLPDDTLAAISVANAGDQLKAAWPEMEKGLRTTLGSQQFEDGLSQVQDALGISVPQDLAAALGSQFTVAFGGMGTDGAPKVAVVGNGDQAVLQKIATAGSVLTSPDELAFRPGQGRSVLAFTDDYATEVATGKGLGGMPGFKDSVRDVDKARVAGYVDISGLVAAFKDESGSSKQDAADIANLAALGFSASGEGNSADFSVRLTTK
ncbi:hypothetical protein GCM10025782_17920 [Pedococcus ginsenosidimutans]|uniref:DUF3352 domain-containing protein n=1 Tax=Pedococcus ginsenosidimutans TaxID=490570 RepID=A0ABP8Y550_9MICO